MTAAELRALVAQGPAVVMVAKDDMLKLLDERERYREALTDALPYLPGARSIPARSTPYSRARAALEPSP
jgi:hypothetical protein